MSPHDNEHAAEIAAQHELRHGCAAVRLDRDVVRVTGEDARSFCQGQLSQDVESLPVGEAAMSLLLEPTGKVTAWVRVWGLADGLLIEADAGAGETVAARLGRFRLRVKADLEPARWQMLAVRGASSPATAPSVEGAELVAPIDWAGLRGWDALGPSVTVPDGMPEVPAAALDVLRIEAGRPAHGTELGPDLDPQVIPAEAGEWLVEQAASFTKGCYTGQELVARVESRGSNTPRKLRGLVLADVRAAVPPPGAVVVADGEDRGTLSSVGWSAELGAAVALAYVHRSVDPGAEVTLRWDAPNGQGDAPVLDAAAVLRALPLVEG